MPDPVPLDTFRRIVRGDEDEIRATFYRRHKKQVEESARLAHAAFSALHECHPHWDTTNRRRMTCAHMIHLCVHNLLTSVALLSSGYPVPAGNAMRQYAEALAMALLFSDESLPDYDRFENNRQHFDAGAAPQRLANKKVGRSVQQRLSVTSDGWQALIDTQKLYSQHSHNSAFAISFNFSWRKKEGTILGAHYDIKKHNVYKAELAARVQALRAVKDLVAIFDRIWSNDGEHPIATA